MHSHLSNSFLTRYSIYKHDPTMTPQEVITSRKALMCIEGCAEAARGGDEHKEKFFKKHKIWPESHNTPTPDQRGMCYYYSNNQVDPTLNIAQHHWQTNFFPPIF